MQYHCVQCDEVFTLDASEDKPRCPKCLRTHGLRPIEGPKPVQQPRRFVAPVLVVLLLGAAAGGYTYYRQQHHHAPGQVPLAPVDADAVRADVRVLSGVDPGALAQLFAADAKLSAFAEHAIQGVGASADAKAKAVVAALQARKAKQAFVPWPRSEPREGPPLTASAAYAAIERDGARRELYPLELSAIAVAALRSQGVPALLAEVYAYPNERAPVDPSGRFGYHAVFVPSSGESHSGAGQPRGKLYDAYAGRSAQPTDYAVLNDAQAIGAAFAIRALTELDAADTQRGLADSGVAVKLLPSSPSARSVRASLLLSTGGVEAGTHELDAAAQLRDDAPRHNNLAGMALMSGDPNEAAKQVAKALSEAPDYALAHVTLASVHLMRDEWDLARSELEQAQRLEPNLALLPQSWAQYYASTNDLDRALQQAREAVRRRPKDPQSMLVLARIDRAAGHYDDMRKQARAIMQHVPSDQTDRMKDLLKNLLGPTAFEDTTDSADATNAPASDALSQNQAASTGPHLALDPAQAEPGALQLQPGAPKLHLGGGSSQLKLDLKP